MAETDGPLPGDDEKDGVIPPPPTGTTDATILASGAGLGAAAGAGATLLGGGSPATASPAVGPGGIPFAQGPTVGPAGVPFDAVATGPSGVPMSSSPTVGPGGVPIGGGATGPTGVPLQTGPGIGPTGVPIGPVARRGRNLWIAGTAAVVAVAIGVAVATADDSPAQTAATSTVAAGDPGTTAASESTAAATTVVLAPVVCTAGTWIADNESVATAFISFAALTGAQGSIELDSVTGTIRAEIGADGSVVTTLDNWQMSAVFPNGAGMGVVTVDGVQTGVLTFGEDGTYAVGEMRIDSTMQASVGGVVFLNGPSTDAFFQGSGAFTCDGDLLTMDFATELGTYPATFSRDG